MPKPIYDKLPRISTKELSIIELLISKGEMYGLEMVEASEGSLKRGTIYVTLQRLNEKGFVSSREEPRIQPEIGVARRKYSVTGLGELVYRTHLRANEIFASEFAWEG